MRKHTGGGSGSGSRRRKSPKTVSGWRKPTSSGVQQPFVQLNWTKLAPVSVAVTVWDPEPLGRAEGTTKLRDEGVFPELQGHFRAKETLTHMVAEETERKIKSFLSDKQREKISTPFSTPSSHRFHLNAFDPTALALFKFARIKTSETPAIFGHSIAVLVGRILELDDGLLDRKSVV